MSGNSRNAASRTRDRLLQSFNSLVLSGAEGKITVADIVREAGVGRSTFYDHYTSANDIHEQALAAPMGMLADCILGARSGEELTGLLNHFWENRIRARHTLSGQEGERVEALLASIIESRLAASAHRNDDARKAAAIELAVVPLALIRAWLNDTIRGTGKEIASHLCEASARTRQALL